ncbi:threonine/homoserine/homoserine lactone efflux protein [Agromyces flavus]|uniref:Threonine/homoserine/homoserine lactone efflux protein n=1 Tax=Agromyces flavus TaxID=589382 RepID=A0A1H1W6W4_9MICO|nr:LysE family transporter [Agromyces flavus]MCP2366101.1 threonine/homoserine/homoserine lactone efflux protein [Agromyces flavus]GGI44004.1 lysine transporter LysE [Agromyces flavus]SDS92907.1 Threonine/homoserine/homoserine lactone efflux protein [Agromyces flavus]
MAQREAKPGSGFPRDIRTVLFMDGQLLLACSVMMVLMVLLPGPDWAYLIATGIRERSIVPSLAGILLGYLSTVAAVAIGVGAAVAALPWFIVALTLAAAVYLTYLGVRVLREPPVVAAVAGGAAVAAGGGDAATPGGAAGAAGGGDAATPGGAGGATSARPWMRLLQGAGVSGLNPKGLLVLVVLLPQFTDAAGAWPIPVQLAVLGLIFVGACALVYTAVGFGARTVLRLRPSAMRVVSRVSGAAMIVLAVVLVVEQAGHLIGG